MAKDPDIKRPQGVPAIRQPDQVLKTMGEPRLMEIPVKPQTSRPDKPPHLNGVGD